MKQILQSARGGRVCVAEVPAPPATSGCALVRVAASLVSAGTERAAAEFAAKSLVQKARARPDLVKEVISKIRRDGVLNAVSAVRSRLDQPLALGYSSAGTIVEVGAGVDDLRPGDRVACAGAGYAVHAEFINVPRLLTAKIPDESIDFDSAALATLGAIALHAIRTAEAKLGETVAVIGLGLIGQLAAQILRAAGCSVIGIDPVQERVNLALDLGVTSASASEGEFRTLCAQHSCGYGVDSVLITAETPSNEPVNLAAAIARDRAIIVAVGAVGTHLERRPYYEKELDFRISRSYGPGRYDAAFEQKGRDYPIGHVRWTETRNMEAFLQLLAQGKVNVRPLISDRFAIEDGPSAYDLITGRLQRPHLGVVLQYSADERNESRRLNLLPSRQASPSQVRVGVIGAGAFARAVLIPAIKKDVFTQLAAITSSNGVRAQSAARKFGFEYCTTDESQVLCDDSINTIVIASRHNRHAEQVIRAIEHGKNVFCEKPLCLNEDELHSITAAYTCAQHCRLMVGFNRRFAPMVRRIKTFLSLAGGPFTMTCRVNAGPLPGDHWVNDPEEGGGRILGELCHFVDLLSYLNGSQACSVEACGFRATGGQDVMATIRFENGSIGTICYACNGDRSFSKERVEVFGSGLVATLDDFRSLHMVRDGKKHSLRSWLGQDKGHIAEWRAFSHSIVSGDPSPIAFAEIVASTLATIRIAEALRSGRALTMVRTDSPSTGMPLICESPLLSHHPAHS